MTSSSWVADAEVDINLWMTPHFFQKEFPEDGRESWRRLALFAISFVYQRRSSVLLSEEHIGSFPSKFANHGARLLDKGVWM